MIVFINSKFTYTISFYSVVHEVVNITKYIAEAKAVFML